MSLTQSLPAIGQRRLTVIGDVIVDRYIYGTAIGKSAETPTIVARHDSTTVSLGGASLVVRHLLELGARVRFITVVGGDDEAAIVSGFTHSRLQADLMSLPHRRTTVKTRYWVDGYKLLQFDTLDDRPVGEQAEGHVVEALDRGLTDSDAVILSDYRHGLLSAELAGRIVRRCRDAGVPLYVDSQVSQRAANHQIYAGATTFVLNLREALALDAHFDPDHAAAATFAALLEMLACRHIVVKLGAAGSIACIDGRIIQSPALSIQAVDTCGAGDAFLAALCLGDMAVPEAALLLANRWAGLSTLVHGANPPSRAQIFPGAAMPQ